MLTSSWMHSLQSTGITHRLAFVGFARERHRVRGSGLHCVLSVALRGMLRVNLPEVVTHSLRARTSVQHVIQSAGQCIVALDPDEHAVGCIRTLRDGHLPLLCIYKAVASMMPRHIEAMVRRTPQHRRAWAGPRRRVVLWWTEGHRRRQWRCTRYDPSKAAHESW